ncbi:hypothetical protein [Cupriavidus sp. UYPR2.512]|uniref:hypothetical protein n=1 Tax=Cupriavidus sp. UYPR2.512 TaxID=1080187 RepID=UPI0003A5E1D0|nr:hypothetical protein [Cupriavidus sp. UYPR2.512]UIF89306.1 hypothetical protein KAF44_30540 [Cupriavidus necator]
MNQQTHEEICSVPIIPRMFFPYVVKVIASDTCYPIDFEAKGLLFENGAVVIEYPFKDPERK